jgi:hypothetical protein
MSVPPEDSSSTVGPTDALSAGWACVDLTEAPIDNKPQTLKIRVRAAKLDVDKLRAIETPLFRR